jgi:hypothetical protein
VLIQSRPYNSSHRWSAVADLHTSPVITIDIQQMYDKRYGVGTVLAELGFAEPAIQWVVLFLNPEDDEGPCGVCV